MPVYGRDCPKRAFILLLVDDAKYSPRLPNDRHKLLNGNERQVNDEKLCKNWFLKQTDHFPNINRYFKFIPKQTNHKVVREDSEISENFSKTDCMRCRSVCTLIRHG